MRTLLLCAALLCSAAGAAQSFEQDDGQFVYYWRAIKCDTLEHLRSILTAAQSGGPYASSEQFDRINASARRPGTEPCQAMRLSSRLMKKSVGHYEAIELRLNKLDDVVVFEIVERGHKPWYAAVLHEVGGGKTI